LENVTEGSEQWNRIIGQTQLPEQYTVDLSGGITMRIKLFPAKYKQTLVFNLSMNNLLNKQDIISGGYEQLRFDTDTKNTGKISSKIFLCVGLKFFFQLFIAFIKKIMKQNIIRYIQWSIFLSLLWQVSAVIKNLIHLLHIAALDTGKSFDT
jgi:hypothetical protein